MNDTEQLQQQIAQLKKENEQLRHENQRGAVRLGQFQDVAKIVAGEPDRAGLIEQLAAQVATSLNAERVLLGVYVNGTIVFEQPVYADDEEVAAWVTAHKRLYLSPSDKADLFDIEMNSILAVPILNHQRHLLGVIVCHRPPHQLPFTQNDVDLLQMIALQVAPGLARSLLFDQMQRWTGSFENLLMFSASLNGKLEPAVLIRRLVEHATGFLGAEAGFAGLTGPVDLVSDGYWHQGQWQSFEQHWPPDEELCTPGWVLINQCPYLTNAYEQDTLAASVLVDRFAVKNALCVPIMDAREEVLGFVELHNKGGGQEPFTWSDAHFLEALASSTAISLYNAYLLDELALQKGRLQALTARNLTLLEDERQRIARELHDEAGQVLIGVKLELQILAKRVAKMAPDLQQEFDRLRREVNSATTKIKEIARALRPPILDEMGLEVAIKRQISDFQKRSDIQIIYDSVNLVTRLPQAVETACYRLVQEALTNILRHAQADQAWVTLTCDDDKLYLCIQDNGCGFDTTQQKQVGLGLLGMQERVIMLDGSFSIETAPQAGTSVNIVIPTTQSHPPSELNGRFTTDIR